MNVENNSSFRPFEKIHIHFDKEAYLAGDTLWFKAYITQGNFHEPTTLSQVLYVEFINEKNEILDHLNLRVEDGISFGEIPIPLSIHSGMYRIRSYTRFMRNDSLYFFNRFIPISNPILDSLNNQPLIKDYLAKNKIKDSLKIEIIPEGGKLVYGIGSNLVFRAINNQNEPEEITGKIIDNFGDSITHFKTEFKGMGKFYLRPNKPLNYKALVYRKTGETDTINLPEIENSGISLRLIPSEDSIKMRISINQAYSKNRSDSIFNILVQSQGKTYFETKGSVLGTFFSLNIPKSIFPSGIAQIIIADQKFNILCQRLTFIKSNDRLEFQGQSTKDQYKPGENIDANFTLLGPNNKPSIAHCSVSVVLENSKNTIIEGNNIFGDILLASELQAPMDYSKDYFDLSHQEESELDMKLILRNAYRFPFKNQMEGEDTVLLFKNEKGITVSGHVLNNKGLPLSNAEIGLTSLRDKIISSTKTDEKGKFIFQNLDLNDSSRVILKGSYTKSTGPIKIVMDSRDFATVMPFTNHLFNQNKPKEEFSPDNLKPTNQENPEGFKLSKSKKNNILEKNPIETPKKAIKLNEVKVIANNKKNPNDTKRIEELPTSSRLHGAGIVDQVIWGEKLVGCPNLTDCLRGKIFGVFWKDFSGTVLPVRLKFLSLSHPPPMYIFIDGHKINNDEFQFIDPNSISSIEVVTSGNTFAYLYGVSPIPGILFINLYKDRPQYLTLNQADKGILTFYADGFHNPKEFISPKFQASKASIPSPCPKTIYWNPNLVADSTGKINFSFKNDWVPGTYRITLEGIDKNGFMGNRIFRYQVKN